jgi:hypothetical protein
LAIAITLLLAAAAVYAAPAAQQGSIRITPAVIRLELAKGASEVRTTVTLTNTYAAAVTLQFHLSNTSQNIPGNVDPVTLVTIDDGTVTIPANGSTTQTLTLRDSNKLSPGSQALELVVTQQSAGGQGVGIQPAVRLPVNIIKTDGAVTSLGPMSIVGPSFATQTPTTVDVTVKNTGNMMAIPRGSITIRDPHGKEVGHGVINVASAAVMPGKSLTIPVSITTAGSAVLPGSYQIQALYGLGGDSAERTSQTNYTFIGWQHAAITAVAACAIITTIRIVRTAKSYMRLRRQRHEPAKAPPTKRRILIGRNA